MIARKSTNYFVSPLIFHMENVHSENIVSEHRGSFFHLHSSQWESFNLQFGNFYRFPARAVSVVCGWWATRMRADVRLMGARKYILQDYLCAKREEKVKSLKTRSLLTPLARAFLTHHQNYFSGVFLGKFDAFSLNEISKFSRKPKTSSRALTMSLSHLALLLVTAAIHCCSFMTTHKNYSRSREKWESNENFLKLPTIDIFTHSRRTCCCSKFYRRFDRFSQTFTWFNSGSIQMLCVSVENVNQLTILTLKL